MTAAIAATKPPQGDGRQRVAGVEGGAHGLPKRGAISLRGAAASRRPALAVRSRGRIASASSGRLRFAGEMLEPQIFRLAFRVIDSRDEALTDAVHDGRGAGGG